MSLTTQRTQQTLARTTCVSGFGLFNGCDVTIEFCPADEDHGIVFERVDLSEPVRIPALIDYVVPQNRCTVISHQGAKVSVIEHVMAALAGLHVDNCLVRINAPEPPGCDGSSLEFVEAILHAGIIRQTRPRLCLDVCHPVTHLESNRVGIAAQSSPDSDYQIGFLLDYGPGPIPFQAFNLTITPSTFLEQLANCRTFVLQSEVEQLQAAGLGRRATPQNVLVFTDHGVLENSLRWPDECVRHKILDCVGDFALLGCDLTGRFTASRSGHRLNHEMIRQLRQAHLPTVLPTASSISLPASVPMSESLTHPSPTMRQSPHFKSPRTSSSTVSISTVQK